MPLLSPRKICEAEPSFQLLSEIIALSVANDWDMAVREWSLFDVFYSEIPGQCLCSHWPINEHCILHNRENGNRAVVGNVCVKKFLGLPSGKIFDACNSIAEDNSRSVNSETLEHAHGKNWINDWEKSFYENTLRKRKLSPKQKFKRQQINESILFYFRQGK